MSTLSSALQKPTTLDEQVESICTVSLLAATSRIKVILANADGYTPHQLREILESALAREVRSRPQRRAIIQSLKAAIKKLPAAAGQVSIPEILDKSANVPAKLDPAWDNARLYYRAVNSTGRQFLVAQICLGWELHNKKQALGFTRGNNKAGPFGQFGQTGRSWEQWLESELGKELPRRTADRIIQVYLGFCEKCPKKLRVMFEGGARRNLITALSKPPTSLTEKDRKIVETAIAKASDGETQRSLLEELNLVKRHDTSGIGGDTSAHKKKRPSDEELMGQLAFKFFKPLADTLVSIRSNKDREAFLHTIPITSSEPEEISLTTLENDLEAALLDVRAAKKARLKPAAGKVIK